jgi:hypothetical protein
MDILNVDVKSRSLVAEHPDGNQEIIYPERLSKMLPVEVYEKEIAQISTGMRIKMTKTDKERDILANREWRVESIHQDKIGIIDKLTGRSFSMNPNELKDCHWDYAYTVTGYGAQGSSSPYVLGLQVSYSKNLANLRAFYIVPSRAKQHVLILTDDKEKLQKSVTENSGDKYSALEVIGQYNSKTTLPRGYQAKEATMVEKSTPTIEHRSHDTPTNQTKRLDAKEVEASLKEKSEMVALSILGESNKKLSSRNELRYGAKGSLSVKIGGDRQGQWKDFESGEGGGMISLISEKLSLNFKEALEYGASLIGSNPINIEKPRWKTTPKVAEKNAYNNTEKAVQLVKESLPIAGTLAESYLQKTRGVAINQCENLRFIPRVYTGKGNAETVKYAPAMLSMAKDSKGEIRSVQLTYLDHKSLDKANVSIKKRTIGSPQGASVLLQKGTHKTYITEGVETGLSVANAKPDAHVIATLSKSNFSKLASDSLHENIVFCLDNDGKDTFKLSNLSFLLSTMERLEREGKNVSIVMPESEKNDFNDVLKSKGIKEVNAIINNEISLKDVQKISKKILRDTQSKPEIFPYKETAIQIDKKIKFSISNFIHENDNAMKNLNNQINNVQKNQQLLDNESTKQATKIAQVEREI